MFLVLIGLVSGQAATLTVGSGGYDTIAEAVSASAPGDTLIIEAGTYAECVDLGGKSLILAGAGASVTEIVGDGSCTSVLTLIAGEDASISGLTLENSAGRAIEIDGGVVTLQDLVVQDAGTSSLDGGGVSATDAELSVVDCVFQDNVGDLGGHLYLSDANLVLSGGELVRGAASGDGGAVYASWVAGSARGGSIEISATSFQGNTAAEDGGALAAEVDDFEWAIDVVSTGCTWAENRATSGGGGALRLYGADLLVTDDVFEANSSYEGGGALSHSYGNIHLFTSTFEDNVSETASGGAIRFEDGSEYSSELLIDGCSFEDNVATAWGGAAYVTSVGELNLTDSTLVENVAAGNGGALALRWVNGSQSTGNLLCGNSATDGGAVYMIYDDEYSSPNSNWYENVFVENIASDEGGAIYSDHKESTKLVDNTFVGNSAETSGGALYAVATTTSAYNNIFAWSSGDGVVLYAYTSPTFNYNDWYENTDADASGGSAISTSTDGNISEDPEFVAYTQNGDCTDDDLRLVAGSPLLYTGVETSADELGTIGAYGVADAERVDTDGDGSMDDVDCEPADPSISTLQEELCNEIDDDCDGLEDEAEDVDPSALISTWLDEDEDGYGAGDAVAACQPARHYVTVDGDCDDTDASVYPGATETEGDGIDSDCSGADETGDTSAAPSADTAAEEPVSKTDEGGRCAAAPGSASVVSLALSLLTLAAARGKRRDSAWQRLSPPPVPGQTTSLTIPSTATTRHSPHASPGSSRTASPPHGTPQGR